MLRGKVTVSNIGFTCGAFDLLHAGHIAFLKECKSRCDRLVVGLQTDPSIDRSEKNSPIQSVVERQIQLDACKYVDCVLFYETEADLEEILSMYHIDVRFLGSDYYGKEITGSDICEKRHIETLYIMRTHEFSTSELRERAANADR